MTWHFDYRLSISDSDPGIETLKFVNVEDGHIANPMTKYVPLLALGLPNKYRSMREIKTSSHWNTYGRMSELIYVDIHVTWICTAMLCADMGDLPLVFWG